MATDHNFKVKNGLDVLGGRASIAASGTNSVDSLKLHVGTINNSGSSAIAQFGGFIRASEYYILHETTGSGNSLFIDYVGNDLDVRVGEGSYTGVIRTNGYKVGTTTVIDSSRNIMGAGINSTANYTELGTTTASNLVFKRTNASYIQADGSGGYFIFITSGRSTSYANRALALTTDNNAEFGGAINTVGNVTVGGDLIVNGTTTTLNTATLNVEDKNIVLNYASGDTSSTADGAGITIQDAVNSSTDATILWDATNDRFNFSHRVNIAGNLSAYHIYGQDHYVLNAAADGWHRWAQRSGGKVNLDVNTISSGAITTSSGMVVTDTSSTGRGIYRNNTGYDLRVGGGTNSNNGAYISISGETRGGSNSAYNGRIEYYSGGTGFANQAAILGDHVWYAKHAGGSAELMTLDSATGHLNLKLGGFYLNGTTVIDSSRNFYAVGMTTTSGVTIGGGLTTGTINVNPQDSTNEGGEIVLKGAGSNEHVYIDNRVGNFRVFDGSSPQVRLSLNTDGNATFAGTISSGGITTSANIDFTAATSLLRNLDDNSGQIGIQVKNSGGTAREVRWDAANNTNGAWRATTNGAADLGLTNKIWNNLFVNTIKVGTGNVEVIDSSRNISAARIRTNDGTPSAPTYSFSSDTNTGMYRNSDDIVGIATGGARRAYFASSGIHSDANVYAINDFRNYGGSWRASTGLTGNGFSFINSVDGTAMTLSSTGVANFAGNLTAPNLIASTATYSPIVYGGSSSLQLKSNTSEMFAQFTNDGAAALYFNNVSKFVTQSYGANLSGVLLANDGSASAPTFSFSNDSDTGMYRHTTNSLGFSAAGGAGMVLNASGLTITNHVAINNYVMSADVALGVRGHGTSGSQYIFSAQDSAGSTKFYVRDDGVTVHQGSGYLYAASSGVSFYSQNSSVFRGAISNDQGDLTLADNVDITSSGTLKIAGTTVIDSGRNLLSIGSISASTLTTSGDITVNGNDITMAASNARVKYRVWSNDTYGIGMHNSVTYGGINTDYAMTFQMNNDVDRGFLWFDSDDTLAQGAMALTTEGKLTVADATRIGFGKNDTTAPNSSTAMLHVNGTISSGSITAGNSSTAASLRAHYNDGSYMTLTGYGLEMNRAASYIRPTTDGDKTLYIGGADASLDWNAIHFRSVNGLYMTGTRFIDTSRNLSNIGTISSGAITSTGRSTFDSVTIDDDGSNSPLLRIVADNHDPWAFQIENASASNSGLFQAYINNNNDLYFRLKETGAYPTWYFQISNASNHVNSMYLNSSGINSPGHVDVASVKISTTTVIDSSRRFGANVTPNASYAINALQSGSLTRAAYFQANGGTGTGLEINATAGTYSGDALYVRQSTVSTGGNLARFSNSAGDKFIVTTAGNVGINVASPSSALDIRGAGSGGSQKNTIAFGNSGWGGPLAPNAALDGGVKLALFEGATQKVQIGMDGSARMWLSSCGAGANGVDIYTGSSNTAAPSLRFRVDQSGTTNIYGNLNLTSNNLQIGGTTVINSSRQAKNVTLLGGTGGAKFQSNNWFYDDDNDGRLYFALNGPTYYKSTSGHRFRANGDVTRLTIDAAGRVNLYSGGDTNAPGGAALAVAGTSVLTTGRVLQNVSADTTASISPLVRGSVSNVDNTGYVHAFKVDGSALASQIRFTVAGTVGSVVISNDVSIVCNHYRDILIESTSGFYTVLTIKVVSNGNEDFSVYFKSNSPNTATVSVVVFPLNDETVTITTTDPGYSGKTLEHTCDYGKKFSATNNTTPDQFDITTDGDIDANKYQISGTTVIGADRTVRAANGSVASPTISFSADTDTGLYRYGTNQLGFVTAGAYRGMFDNSGNFIVGGTSNVPGAGNAATGVSLYNDGRIFAAKDGNTVMSLNRNSSNGVIAEFRYGGNLIGNMGVEGGDSFFIQSDGTGGGGLRFHNSGRISPVRNGALINNTIDLGASTQQFASLYLGTGLYMGGSNIIDASRNLNNISSITTSSDINLGNGTANSRLFLKKADNNVADHIIFYNGTTRVGEIGVSDNTWLRINQTTGNNIYTPRYIRADSGFFVDNASMGIDGSGRLRAFAGSNSSVGIGFVNDINTGFTNPSADTIDVVTAGDAHARFDSTGNLIVEGNVTAYGSVSDIRLKENIEVIPNAVEKIQKLEGITFNYKKDGGRSTGLIAQQLQEVLPEAVYKAKDLDEEEHLAVKYGNVVGLLVEAIKEQQTQLTAQQEQINQLTHLVNTLMEK